MRHSNQPVRTKGGGRGWTREAPRRKVARSRGGAARGNATTNRQTRGKREERLQWTLGDGASRGRGCTSRGGGGASRGGGAARGNTTTSRGEREVNMRGGVSKQEAAAPRMPAGLLRGQEAAVVAQRDSSRQPAGAQDANGRGGTSRQEATASRKPAAPRDDERQRLHCTRTKEGHSAS